MIRTIPAHSFSVTRSRFVTAQKAFLLMLLSKTCFLVFVSLSVDHILTSRVDLWKVTWPATHLNVWQFQII